MKPGTIRPAAAALFPLFFAAAAVFAQRPDIEVVKSPTSRPRLAIGPFSGDQGKALAEIVRNDLAINGSFEMAAPASADYIVRGSAESKGGSPAAVCRIFAGGTTRQIQGRSYKGGDLRALAHRISDDIVETLTDLKGIARTKIAFISNRTGKKELYIMDYDGHRVRQLTRDRSISVAPAWTPDGRKIVYTSYRLGWPDVYLIDLAAGKRRRISAFPGLNSGAAVSPDGRWIALTLSRDRNPELYLLPLTGGTPRRLTRTPRAGEASPTWSPDGRRIAYVSDMAGTPQLYMISSNGGAPQRITRTGSENVEPDWSRANGLIAFVTRRGGRYRTALYDPNTREARILTPADADYQDPSWAPDGVHLVCSRTVRYRSDLVILDTRDGKIVPITRNMGDCHSPAWSPR